MKRETVLLAAMLLWLLAGCASDDIPGVQKRSVENIRIDESQKGKLVFQLSGLYSNTPQYAISTMNSDGSGLKQLTNPPPDYSYSTEDPARSPDFKKIAFTRVVSQDPSSADASAESESDASAESVGPVPYIFLMNADGSDEIQFSDRAAAKADWSPDGKQVAFSSDEVWSSSGVSEEGDCDLYVASVDDPGTFSRLTDGPGCESNASWSPDGKRVAFTSDRGGNLDIYVIDACCVEQGITNRPQQLTDDPLDDTDPAWSPDGTRIAFTKSEPVREDVYDTSGTPRFPVPESDVYKMDVDGSEKTRLTQSEAFEAQPTWSPDGKRIAFTRQAFPGAALRKTANATTGIFVMDSDGTDPAIVRIFQNRIASFPEWGGTAQQDKDPTPANEGVPTEEAIADWRALDARLPDAAVEAYIEQMNELLRGENLRDPHQSLVQSEATYMTESQLAGLESSGREKVVRFLAESGFLHGTPLNGADLSDTDLSDVNLSGAQGSYINLSGANLSNANLSKAFVMNSSLSGADLSSANLNGAILEASDLGDANLSGTNLSNASLNGTQVTEEQLEQAESLEGATMPDGSQYP